MALVNFTNLDFDQIKSSIIEYLRSNSNFTDYDFEGSNLSTIIDVLAYNTYITSYNANMISNEVFIDSATLRENVVSLAKHIGYTPRSRKCSIANISFFVDTTTFQNPPVTLTLQRGLVCTSSTNFGRQSYTFAIKEDITVPVVNNIAFFDNITVYEGTYITDSYTVNANNPEQRFILNNPNIDISTLSVNIRNSQQSSITRKFNLSDNLYGINSESKVFFIQEIEDQRYELIFGDGIFGKKLDNLNVIEASYIITNGEVANGVSSFAFSGRIFDNNGAIIALGISLITTNANSQQGKEIESVNSIKKYAPRVYSAQNRAVTATDYEALIAKIYPEAESVSVFGGEDLTPPKYGRVYISIKPYNGRFIPNIIKDNIKRSLKKYSVAGIVPEILDLKYLYLEIDSTVYYDSNKTLNPSDLKTIVFDNIISYSNSTELNKYGARFKYSKFLKIIDDSNEAITSNITKVTIRRDLLTVPNKFASYEICYGNEFHIKSLNGFNVKSTGFTVNGISETIYLTDIPNSDQKTGKIIFFKLNSKNEYQIVRTNVGTVDYKKGEIILFPINIRSTEKILGEDYIIEISAIPKSNDVIGLQDLYLQLDTNKSVVNMVSDTISSGSDTSGLKYLSTSSYTNEDLIRS